VSNLSVEKLIDVQIVLPNAIALPEETKAIRSILLADSQFTAIADRNQAECVGVSARNIRTHIKAVRDMGMTLRRPLKATQDQIKAIEDEYCRPLEDRQAKLENLVTSYARAEALRVAEEERKRQAEVRRIEAERIAAETKAREEQQRIEREAWAAQERARQQSEAMTASERFRAGIAEEERRKQAEEAKAKADADIEQARVDSMAKLSVAVAAPIVEHKIAGAATKRVCKWEVTDEKALFKARPELFKVELKRSAVNAVCFPNSFEATADNPDATSVPGLKLWYENETVVRAYGS
jgi:hypothetical protein